MKIVFRQRRNPGCGSVRVGITLRIGKPRGAADKEKGMTAWLVAVAQCKEHRFGVLSYRRRVRGERLVIVLVTVTKSQVLGSQV